MRRHAIGILALVLITGWAIFWIWPPQGVAALQLQAACGRMGMLTCLVWLAYDQLRRLPLWLWPVLPVLGIVLARWPRLFVIAVPIVVFLTLLRPRYRPRPK